MKRYAVLDRDGTLVVERGHLTDSSQLELERGAASGLRRLSALGLGLIVITNQSAVGRGLIDGARLEDIHRTLRGLLAAHEVSLDGIYVCPHTPEEGCSCRKPGTELLERAAREHAFDARESFVIGDKACDIELGRRAGATTILVATGYGAETARDPSVAPDHHAEDLRDAAACIAALLSADRGESAQKGGDGA